MSSSHYNIRRTSTPIQYLPTSTSDGQGSAPPSSGQRRAHRQRQHQRPQQHRRRRGAAPRRATLQRQVPHAVRERARQRTGQQMCKRATHRRSAQSRHDTPSPTRGAPSRAAPRRPCTRARAVGDQIQLTAPGFGVRRPGPRLHDRCTCQCSNDAVAVRVRGRMRE
jgi:hypothetical protein